MLIPCFLHRCTQVPDSIPFPVTELTFIGLEYSFIPFQMSQTIEGAESITRISFQKSLISSLAPHAFTAFPNLRNLDLSGLNIRQVDLEAFTQLPKLEVLILKNNQLTESVVPAFSVLGSSLHVLNIEDNIVQHLGKNEVLHLRMLERLKSFQFANNRIFCDCELFHLSKWQEFTQVQFPAGPICKERFSELTLEELRGFFDTCSVLQRPVVTNITSLSCHSLFLQWEFDAYVESNTSAVLFTVTFKSRTSSLSLQTSKSEIIVNNLSPDTTYDLSIAVSTTGSESSNDLQDHIKRQQQFPVRITQYESDGNLYNCLVKPSSYLASTLTWDLTYKIIIFLVLIFIALLTIIFCGALSSFVCRKRSSLTPTRYEPRPAYGHEPQIGNAAALLAYAHLDFEGPRASCDHLKRQIINTQGVTTVNPQNITYTSVLLTGKFGTMFEGEAIFVRRNQYRCKVTAIEFSQRRLFERSGNKLTELASLSHPNVLNILGVVDILANGPLTLLFDHLVDYLDVKTFLHQVVQGYSNFGASPPNEAKNLIISQIAAGMKYLSQKQFVHGDLSARNCVFTRSRQVKISLTGAGVDLYPYDYFQNGGRSLPIRWMSPECIQYGTCSSHSDVWSMGVLMWEVYSNGAMPYHYIADTEVVAASVISKGSLLKQPRDCPKEVWNIIRDCWIGEPMSRINFENIESRLLKDVWNVSVVDDTTDNESVTQYQTVLNRLHLTSVLGLSADPAEQSELDQSSFVSLATASPNNLSAYMHTNRTIRPAHWV